jgi:hypothetical protein
MPSGQTHKSHFAIDFNRKSIFLSFHYCGSGIESHAPSISGQSNRIPFADGAYYRHDTTLAENNEIDL